VRTPEQGENGGRAKNIVATEIFGEIRPVEKDGEGRGIGDARFLICHEFPRGNIQPSNCLSATVAYREAWLAELESVNRVDRDPISEFHQNVVFKYLKLNNLRSGISWQIKKPGSPAP
jgi:hypothetical protein